MNKQSVYFELPAYHKISAYIKEADGEISGIGQAVYNKEYNCFIVKDIFIYKQVCGSAETEITDTKELFKLVFELEKAGVPISELCLWWHSHATMETFFSGQDQETIKRWINNRFLISIVGNKAGEFKAQLDLKNEIPVSAELEVIKPDLTPAEITEAVKAEIKAKVSEFEYPIYSGYGYDTGEYKTGGKKGKQLKLVGFKGSLIDKIEADTAEIEDMKDESAEICGCPSCVSYLAGTGKFSTKKHRFDPSARLYILKKKYAKKYKMDYPLC